jgi:hypothetical protein
MQRFAEAATVGTQPTIKNIPMPKKKPSDLAQALLDAHVAFMVEQLSGDALSALVDAQIDAALADAARLKLKDAVSPKMIKDTARTFAVEMEPAGGLPELVAEIARALYAHEIHAKTTPNDLVTHARYEQVIDKLLELRSLREKFVREAVSSPIYIAFATDLLYHGIKGYLARSGELTRNIPGASSVMKLGKSMMNKASPGLEDTLEDSLKKYVARSVEVTARSSAEFVLKHLTDDALRKMAREIWDRNKFVPLAQLREDLDSDDLEDLFVDTYEFWRELRQTKFYSAMIDRAIDVLFEIYGNTSLAELLDELGVTREHMRGEAMRYLPHVIKLLKRKKLLEPMLRRQLEGFYLSGQVEAVLERHA